MRIDNFVYTKESFEEAKALLAPDGVLFVKFQVNHPWLGKPLAEMLPGIRQAPGRVRARSSFTADATCFAISTSQQVEHRLAADARVERICDPKSSRFLDCLLCP